MPWPVSLTTSSTRESTRCERTCTRPPRGVNLTAFDSRFHTTCCSRSGIARDRRRSPRRPSIWSARPSRRRPAAPSPTASVDDGGELDRLHVQPELAGDDPRHVEHVVDRSASAPAALRSARRRRATGASPLAGRPCAASARSRGSRSAASAARATACARNSSFSRLASWAGGRRSAFRWRARRAPPRPARTARSRPL